MSMDPDTLPPTPGDPSDAFIDAPPKWVCGYNLEVNSRNYEAYQLQAMRDAKRAAERLDAKKYNDAFAAWVYMLEGAGLNMSVRSAKIAFWAGWDARGRK